MFALIVLPTLYLLGVFTFVRVVECGAEDYRYGVAINRIRHYYKQIAGDEAKLFLLSGHDDRRGVFSNAALPEEGRTQFLTFGTVVAVINSVIGGSAMAFATSIVLDPPLGVAAGTGGAVGLLSLAPLIRHANRLLMRRAGTTESISHLRRTVRTSSPAGSKHAPDKEGSPARLTRVVVLSLDGQAPDQASYPDRAWQPRADNSRQRTEPLSRGAHPRPSSLGRLDAAPARCAGL